jgi:voltage-dependent potassium channel beta subunit
MGRILKARDWSRDSYIVSSKAFFGAGAQVPTQRGLSRKHLVEACHQALQRLQLEYLDLYFCHRPDKATPIEETVWTMHNLIQQGKILYWGTSEWSAQEIMEAHMVAKQYHLIGPVVEQPQYNMLVRDKVEVEYSQIYKTVGLGTTIWSPLASGLLTGKYQNGQGDSARLKREELGWLAERLLQEENFAKVEKLQLLSKELGIGLPQLGVAWCLKNPNVSTVILGASKPEQLAETLQSDAHAQSLTPEIMDRIEGILANKPEMPPY